MTARKRGRSIVDMRRDTEFAELRAKGLSYPKIAELRQCAVSTAYASVQRAIRAVPVEAVTELRQIECDRLDAIIAKLWDIVESRHPVFYQGKMIRNTVDDGPVIQALAQIRVTAESKRRLLGLDAPARQTITVITEDAVDAELRRLEEQLAERDRVVGAEAI